MEFFNYRYCILLNNNNENYKINQLINNVNKEIKIYTNRINNSLYIYMTNNCLIKYKLLSIRHTIIKFLISLYNTKKEIKKTNEELTLIETNIFQSSQIINIIKYVNIYDHKVDAILKNQYQYKIKSKISREELVLRAAQLNDILYISSNIYVTPFDVLYLNNIITSAAKINIIILNLKKNIYKKHKKLFNVLCNSFIININNYQQIYTSKILSKDNMEKLKTIEYIIESLLIKILKFDTHPVNVILNNSLLIFFKHKSMICKKNNRLCNNSKKIICINNRNKHKIIKIKLSIDNLICKYKSLCKVITKKKTKIDLVITKYEIMIKKLNILLNNFKHKLLNLEIESENNNTECPLELKKKCIKFNKDDDNVCCFCLDPILLGIKTSCNHIFHIHCINLYIYSIISSSVSEIKILCPLCRKYI